MGRHGISTDALTSGDRRTLARAITLVESELEAHRRDAEALLESLLPHTGGSLRLGITGTPGVGKSTFIETFGLHLLEQGHRVAVLAVDPSSPRGGGSILGDKTRMASLSRSEHAFIRPSPAGDSPGGVAHKTRECMLLCEAAGYDIVVVETVGVGQSGVDVADMVDFFLVLLQPNSGDELQGIKRGIVEVADALVVNKADKGHESDAERTALHYRSALAVLRAEAAWQPRVLTCSALSGHNIDTVWRMIGEYRDYAEGGGVLADRRAWQNARWMRRLTMELIERQLKGDERLRSRLAQLEQQVRRGEMSPLAAARQISELL